MMSFRRHRLKSLETRLCLDASALRITEFMASNSGVVLDAQGDDSDWIEVYNSGADPVDLAGLYLTDDDADLTKWQFPQQRIIEPGELLLVFASAKTMSSTATNSTRVFPWRPAASMLRSSMLTARRSSTHSRPSSPLN